jgi:DNA-binding winged helix-turn-helix (wHTH) protein
MLENVPARLVSNTGEIFELKSPAVSLGRAADNQIVIPSSKSSRYHALITCVEGEYLIRDLKSKNGTRINGEAVTDEQLLQNGDRVGLADIHFVFELLAANPNAETATFESITDPEIAPSKTPALELDEAAMTVKLVGQILKPPLSLLEWKLLTLLFHNQGKVCSREVIITEVYQPANPENIPFDTAIETLVSRLRKRLQMSHPAQLPYIKTIRGVGYRLEI